MSTAVQSFHPTKVHDDVVLFLDIFWISFSAVRLNLCVLWWVYICHHRCKMLVDASISVKNML